MDDRRVSAVCHRPFRRAVRGRFPGGPLFTLAGAPRAGRRRRDTPYVRFGRPNGPPPLTGTAHVCPNGRPRGHRGHNHRLSWVPERRVDQPRPPAVGWRQPRDRETEMGEMIEGAAAGVPFVAVPPVDPGAPAALVAGWHLMDAPAGERAMAEAVPMAGLQAWRVYFGLPLSGAQQPEGGYDEVFRRASEDAVLNVFQPVTEQAAGEFPAALAELRDRLPGATGPLGVFGGLV